MSHLFFKRFSYSSCGFAARKENGKSRTRRSLFSWDDRQKNLGVHMLTMIAKEQHACELPWSLRVMEKQFEVCTLFQAYSTFIRRNHSMVWGRKSRAMLVLWAWNWAEDGWLKFWQNQVQQENCISTYVNLSILIYWKRGVHSLIAWKTTLSGFQADFRVE